MYDWRGADDLEFEQEYIRKPVGVHIINIQSVSSENDYAVVRHAGLFC